MNRLAVAAEVERTEVAIRERDEWKTKCDEARALARQLADASAWARDLLDQWNREAASECAAKLAVALAAFDGEPWSKEGA